MKISQLAVVFPSRKVTNEEVLDEIRALSKQFAGNLEPVLRRLRIGLARSGIQTRRWCAPDETSLALTLRACRKALAGLSVGEKPDLVICASVYPELIEPSTANLLAHELALDDVECFDLKEACDGWMKAMKVAQALIETGTYKCIMVVNPEFSMTAGFAIYPNLYDLRFPEQLEYRFPAFTIGEAVAVTIVVPDETSPWKFTNVTRNDLYDLCTVTPSWYGAHPVPSSRVAKDGAGGFTSYGADLYKHGFPLSLETFRRSGIRVDEVDAFFTHSSSKKDWTEVAQTLGLTGVFHDVYEEYGNVVSAAVPTAMALALDEGTLQRGDRVAALVASAGMSFSTASFIF